MKKLIIALTLILISTKVVACDCGFKKLAELQQREIENSECIFIGKITQVNDDLTYQITVIESMDGGDVQGNVYIGQNWKTCQPWVDKEGTWLVYARMIDGFLKMNMCGISRSFEKPIAPPSLSDELVENESLFENKNLTEEELQSKFWEIQRMDLANEIYALRKRRTLAGKASR